MSRAHGRRGTGRSPDPQYGSFDKGIPGGIRHVDANEPAEQQQPAVAEPLEEFRGMMAHGVPPLDVGHYDREMAEHARHPYQSRNLELPPEITPVPVYVVEQAGGPAAIRSASPRSVTCNSSAGDPVRLCGVNPGRTAVMLLNESVSSDARFAKDLSGLTGGRGALLPWPSNSYLTIPTQDELFAISADSGTPAISVIEIYETLARG